MDFAKLNNALKQAEEVKNFLDMTGILGGDESKEKPQTVNSGEDLEAKEREARRQASALIDDEAKNKVVERLKNLSPEQQDAIVDKIEKGAKAAGIKPIPNKLLDEADLEGPGRGEIMLGQTLQKFARGVELVSEFVPGLGTFGGDAASALIYAAGGQIAAAGLRENGHEAKAEGYAKASMAGAGVMLIPGLEWAERLGINVRDGVEKRVMKATVKAHEKNAELEKAETPAVSGDEPEKAKEEPAVEMAEQDTQKVDEPEPEVTTEAAVEPEPVTAEVPEKPVVKEDPQAEVKENPNEMSKEELTKGLDLGALGISFESDAPPDHDEKGGTQMNQEQAVALLKQVDAGTQTVETVSGHDGAAVSGGQKVKTADLVNAM